MAARPVRRFSGIFLKLFVGLWCVLITLGLSVWLISMSYQQVPRLEGSLDFGRVPERTIGTVLTVEKLAGLEGMKEWLLDRKLNYRPEVFVLDEDGNEITGRPIPKRAAEQIKNPKLQNLVREATFDGRKYRIFAVRTDIPPGSYLIAFWHTPLWVQLLLAVLATTLVAGALAWNFARPIRRLEWAMRRASEGDLDLSISPEIGHRYDEIGDLAKRFDAMAARIKGLLTRQQSLFHDVSHELRSPLARMEVAIALANRDPKRASEMLKRIDREVAVLDDLVGALLTYARLDRSAPLEFEDADLAAVLEAVVGDANFEGSSRNVHVVLHLDRREIPLSMNTGAIGHTFENILRNAIRFSPDGSSVVVRTESSDTGVTVRIADQGPGASPDELEKLFEPFVRGAGEKTGTGFGLGLAIARRTVDVHGGTLSARNILPTGLEMTVTLPAKPPKAPPVRR